MPSIGQRNVEDHQVGAKALAALNCLIARAGVGDEKSGAFEAGADGAGEMFVGFDDQNLGGAGPVVKSVAEAGQESVFVDGFLDPAARFRCLLWAELNWRH